MTIEQKRNVGKGKEREIDEEQALPLPVQAEKGTGRKGKRAGQRDGKGSRNGRDRWTLIISQMGA